MPKTRRDENGLGDWSSTGTFLRKPSSGWLHDDRELQDQSSINYKIWYLGCIEVCQSMRTLQYNMRTQVTKEAISRMAEAAEKIQPHKKRKVPKQLNRLLGAMDNRWAGDINLSVSADSLRISNTSSTREIMNHSLPSISFASGGDGSTIDFIGYVAKDPVHERACHVFECKDCSQYVLTTIGQAFELRYKMYLNSPQPEPLTITSTVSRGDSWLVEEDGPTRGGGGGGGGGGGKGGGGGGGGGRGVGGKGGGGRGRGASLVQEEPTYSPPPETGGIYSDLPEFPTDDVLPSPSSSSSSSKEHHLPSLTAVSGGVRSRVYSQLPGFPTVVEDEEQLTNGAAHPRLDNPYDTIHTSPPTSSSFSSSSRYDSTHIPPATGVYSEPGEITSSSEYNYSARMMTIKQSPMTSVNSELIDLTPPLEHPNHIYNNTGPGLQNGAAESTSGSAKMPSSPKPRPKPRPRAGKKPITSVSSSSSAEALYDDASVPMATVKRRGQEAANFHGNDYDDPDVLEEYLAGDHPIKSTGDGLYDDIQDIIAPKPKKRSSPPPLVPKKSVNLSAAPRGGGPNPGGQKSNIRGPRDPPQELPPPPPLYDDPNTVIQGAAGVKGRMNQKVLSNSRIPKFDDTIYAIRNDVVGGGEGGGGGKSEGQTNTSASNRTSSAHQTPDPLAPLPTQPYFHGQISRVESEALLEREGEFLVRESTKIAGQFVLSGMSHDGPQHLLLMDKSGKIRSKDHEFGSVPHLVEYFMSRDAPLVIGKSQVFLRKAVVNAYPSTTTAIH